MENETNNLITETATAENVIANSETEKNKTAKGQIKTAKVLSPAAQGGKRRRNKSFIWGSVVAVALVGLGIGVQIAADSAVALAACIVLGVMGFTFTSCLILDNNFIIDMVIKVFSWGFVRFPGIIFSLSLDGIIWLLTVKLLFWILGILLAILCGILAFVLGLVLSVFVYPYALVKNITRPEAD